MTPRPPRLARDLVRLIARHEDRAAVLHDLSEEFRSMVEEGASPAEARRWYRRQVIGSAVPLLCTRLKNAWADWKSSRVSLLDVRLGLRMLVKYPGLTIVAIFALAVGIPIGLAPMHSAAIFEVDLPVAEGDRIHIVRDFNPPTRRWQPVAPADFRVYQQGLRSFEQMGAFIRLPFNVGIEDERDPAVEGAVVTASAFGILQTQPALGRTFSPDDERMGGADVVVVGHTFWQTRLGGDPKVVGSTVRVSGVPHTVIGVMPEGFQFPYRAHLWLPLRLGAALDDDARRVTAFGRLADGVSMEAAQIDLTGVAAGLAADQPERREGLQAWVSPFTVGMFGMSNAGLNGELGFYFFQILALCVLVVACLNIGMLILVRTTARAGELAVRTALGASRSRVVSQLFFEALLLALLAAGLGLFVADRAAGQLGSLSQLLPYWMDLGVTPKTAVWALSLAALSAAVVGVIPALKVTAGNVQQNMQQAAANRSGVRFGGLSSALIVADVALAVVATGIAFAFSEAMTGVTGEDVTVARQEYLFAELRVFSGRSTEGETRRRLLEQLRSEPGVRAVAMASSLPGTEVERRVLEVEGEPAADPDEAHRATTTAVVPGFFEAMDQTVVAGRTFSDGDEVGDAPAVIVNSAMSGAVLGGRSPLGRRVRLVDRNGTPETDWMEVVGVVDYVSTSLSLTAAQPAVYMATPPERIVPARFAIRVGDNPAGFIPRLRDVTQEVDAEAIIGNARPLADVVSFDEYTVQWIGLGVKVLIGILIALAASGTYALLSFTVTARTREIAIRTALGSPRERILLAIARRALVQLGVGVVIGMALTGRLLTIVAGSGWSPAFPPILMTIVAGFGVMITIVGLACVGPARQGLKIAPSQALKS